MLMQQSFKSEEMKGAFHVVLSYTLSIFTFFLDNYAEIVSTTCAVITTGFVAWHYFKSGKLKEIEAEKTNAELKLLHFRISEENEENERRNDDTNIYD